MPSIQHLNYDVLNCLADYLGAEDLLSLCLTCKNLYQILFERTPSNLAFCEKTLRNSAAYSWEYVTTRKAVSENSAERKGAFREALRRLCARRRAFALDFVYGDGAVVYKLPNSINFLDLQTTGRQASMPLKLICELARTVGRLQKCKLLWLREEIVILNAVIGDDATDLERSYLLAIDFSDPRGSKSLIRPQWFDSRRKYFVRHNRDYLYWGVHSGTSAGHGHREWIVQGVALSQNAAFHTSCADQRFGLRKSVQLQLKDLPGSRIGSEIDFRIHQQYFYAVSNCEFELIEIDWTSFYHCLRFPLGQPGAAIIQRNDHLYRRQNDEGVLNDTFTNLSLQVDEMTGELMIVEARDEIRPQYQLGLQRHVRAWYTTRIDFHDPTQDASAPLGPTNDILLQFRESRSNYAPTQNRFAWQMHSENLHLQDQRKLVQLQHIKYTTYSLNTQSFVNLVLNKHYPSDGGCLQLRSGRRWLQSFQTPTDVVTDPTVYGYNNIQTWPPPACESKFAETAHSVMNYERQQRWPLRVMGDDRFLLILLREDYNRSTDKLLLLSFDKFAPVAALSALGNKDKPARINAASHMHGRNAVVHQPSPTMQTPFVSTEVIYDDYEILDAEDLDLDEVLEDAWP